MRVWRAGAVAATVAVICAGGAWAAMAAISSSPLDADERAVIEEVERGGHSDVADAAHFVEENLAVLLSADVAGEVDGADLAALFEAALSRDVGDGVFESVVSAVTEEGAIHHPKLRPVLGEAAAARLAWFDARINAFTSDNSDQWSELRVAYDAAFDFVREVMRDPAVAERLRELMSDYGQAEVVAAPVAGEQRGFRLRDMGSFQAFFTLAGYEAEKREARLDGDLEAWNDAKEADQERRQEGFVDRAMWVALDRFESDPAVRAAAVGEPFADASGVLKGDLTDSETDALEAWVTNQAREGGLLAEDVISLSAGAEVVRSG